MFGQWFFDALYFRTSYFLNGYVPVVGSIDGGMLAARQTDMLRAREAQMLRSREGQLLRSKEGEILR